MTETAIRTHKDTIDNGADRLALVQRAAAPELRGMVRDYWGYAEQTADPVRRREMPSAGVVFIINLGPPLRVAQPQTDARTVPSGGGFVAGLHETFALTETAGSQEGIEVKLSPLAAYRLLAQPMDSVSNRSVALDALFGPWATELGERLLEAPTWADRFDTLDRALVSRWDLAPPPSLEIAWAWRQMARTGGRVSMATLADEVGWSPKRLIARFREQVGLPPKQVARLLRFERTTHFLLTAASPDWSALARQCGYYDQSHLIHEVQRFAGDTPEGLVRRRLLQGGGFAAD